MSASNTPFDPEKVRRVLWRLDLSVYAPLRSPVSDYCRHYGLDLENELAGVRHYFGVFEAFGYQLASHVFMPAQARGTVFILHGYLDHAGLYRHLIRRCLEQGFAVFIHDLPGHGLSSGRRADIDDFHDYQDILEQALHVYGAQLPAPFYAVGQSTGAAILMDHVLTAKAAGKRPAFRRLLLLAPLVRPAQWGQIRFGYWLIRHVKQRVPRVFRSNSQDQAFLDFVREQDPLQDHWVPMNWIGALKRWVAQMQAKPPCDFPVLLVQGHRDDTVDWRFNTAYVRSHFAVQHDVELAEAGHQLANEREDLRQPVLAALDLLLLAP